jgi:hypothetical protein
MNEFRCPQCKSSFSFYLAHVSVAGKEVTGQPVIACECGACVIPYLGEQANQETITRFEKFLS